MCGKGGVLRKGARDHIIPLRSRAFDFSTHFRSSKTNFTYSHGVSASTAVNSFLEKFPELLFPIYLSRRKLLSTKEFFFHRKLCGF